MATTILKPMKCLRFNNFAELLKFAEEVEARERGVPIGVGACLFFNELDSVTVDDVIKIAHVIHLFQFIATCYEFIPSHDIHCIVLISHIPQVKRLDVIRPSFV